MAKYLIPLLESDVVLETTLTAHPDRILGDPAQLNQAILNLAVNARDAMPSGGKITIRTETVSSTSFESKECVRFMLEDTGVGVDEYLRSRIFEPFLTTKSVEYGDGLGLTVVSEVVRRHCGLVDLDSAPGRGTRVSLDLPLAES